MNARYWKKIRKHARKCGFFWNSKCDSHEELAYAMHLSLRFLCVHSPKNVTNSGFQHCLFEIYTIDCVLLTTAVKVLCVQDICSLTVEEIKILSLLGNVLSVVLRSTIPKTNTVPPGYSMWSETSTRIPDQGCSSTTYFLVRNHSRVRRAPCFGGLKGNSGHYFEFGITTVSA